ncbi:cystatin-A-like [Boleophthalmus pectinirostris]|uniref:cystatin-A-like n=1 Tax=Boleophthalmus pectinirostris TaxID=150288 RepID=UPI002430E817|nr:cystatin-A-like [Boleophthalmus pectinirostris]
MESDQTGEIGDPQPADAEMQTICDSVKSEVEKLTGENYKIFRALSYKKQVVLDITTSSRSSLGTANIWRWMCLWGCLTSALDQSSPKSG